MPALLKAQTEMGAAKKGAANPYFKSKYADLPAVIEVVKDPLNENGIAVFQPTAVRDGKSVVVTRLIHSSGEWVEGETEIVVAKQNDPQAQGSAITYARRYGLQSLLSIPTEDDDGELAMGRTKASKAEALKAVTQAQAGGEEKLASKTSSFRREAAKETKAAVALLAPVVVQSDASEGWV